MPTESRDEPHCNVEQYLRDDPHCNVEQYLNHSLTPVADARRAPLPSALEGCGTQSTQRLYGLPLGETTHFRLGLSKFFYSRFSDGEIRKFWKLQIW